MEVLVSAVQHLFSLSPHSYRPAVAAYLYSHFVFPVVQMVTLLEQDGDLFAYVSSGQSVSGFPGVTVKVLLSDEQVQVCLVWSCIFIVRLCDQGCMKCVTLSWFCAYLYYS